MARIRPYLLAAAGVGLATAARLALSLLLGPRFPFLTFFVAIVAASWYGGFGPSALAVVLSWLVVDRFFLAPNGPLPFFGERWQLGVAFVVVGLALAALGEALRRARGRARASAEEARRVLEAHRRDMDQYRAVYEQAGVGIAELALDGRFLRVNPRYCAIVGRTADELLRLRFRDITHPGDPASNLERFARLADGPPCYTIEERYVREDGRAVWCRTAVALIRDAGGAPARAVAVVEDVTERVRAEEALRASEGRFRDLADIMPQIVWTAGSDGQVDYFNRRWYEYTGMTPETSTGEGWKAAIHPDDLEGFAEARSRGLGVGDIFVAEARLRRRDGGYGWHLVRSAPVKDGAGRVLRRSGTATDIDDRKRAEEALRESEERFRSLADLMPQIVWIARPDHGVEFYNQRWFEYTGLDAERSYSEHGWREVIHPDDADPVHAVYLRAIETGATFEAEYRLRDRHGVYRWHLGRAVAVLDGEGRVARRLGTATDIDDRKRAEQDARFLAEAGAALAALTDEAEALRAVARLAVPHFADWCAVDLVDGAGALHRVAVAHQDPAKVELAYDLHRRYPTRPDAPGGVFQVVCSGRAALVPEITDAMLVAGAQDEEHLRIARDLGLRSYMCVPLAGRGGAFGAITFIGAESGRRYGPDDLRQAEDLARRAAIAVENARLYDALRASDRRKDEFLATLAHELRNPLAPIRNALHLMAHPDPDGRGHEAERAMAERQVAHLARLVDDLMDIARISRGKIELRRQPVELGSIVAHAVAAVRSALEERGHELVVRGPTEPVALDADPTRLEQVLDNLLTNAIKYTEPGGRIALEAGREGDEAVVRVADSGVGIPAAMLSKIFDPFTQVDGHAGHARGGLGIGLGLVKSLVEMHGGRIEARSAGPGLGSEFVVRLPAPPAPTSASTRPPATAAAGGRPRRRRILVVDDNTDAANSLAKLLARLHGQDVRVACDGPAALEAAEAFRPELVLLDIGLPGMDGHEVARRLRARPEFARTRLVALTGWGQDADRRKSQAAGFDRHLVKPIDPATLKDLLLDDEPAAVPVGAVPAPAGP